MNFTQNDVKEAKWFKSKGFNWIGKDRGDTFINPSFSITIKKPVKNEKDGFWEDSVRTDSTLITPDKTLFSALSYEDTEPTKLDDIIKGGKN